MAASGSVLYETVQDKRAETAAATLHRSIEARGGVTILTDGLQQRIGPEVVLPDRPVAITDLGPEQLASLQGGLEAALSPYPPGFIARFAATVALASNVVFWRDTVVGGFFFPRGVCLNVGNLADPGEFIPRLFHHELSSLVRLGAPFDVARWTQFNPPGFHYLDEAAYRALLRNTSHAGGGAALYAQGFVRPYGESDIDDDWNTYAEEVFTHGASFAALIRPYPRMRGKTAMLVDIYRGLDPAFAAYFEQTGLAAAVVAG